MSSKIKKNFSRKVLICIFVGVIITIFILVTILFVYFKKIAQTDELVIPKNVNIHLGSLVEKNTRIPILYLSAVAGNGCDSASDMIVNQQINNDNLIIDVKGYKFTSGLNPGLSLCPQVIIESHASVKINANWVKQANDKEIVLELGARKYMYKFSFSKYKATLIGVRATIYGFNISEKLGTSEIILYPVDVAVMYLGGYVSFDKNYKPAMEDFARARGFKLANEVYEGIEQTEKNWLYVVVGEKDMPKENYAQSLGKLPGEEGVGVNIKRP